MSEFGSADLRWWDGQRWSVGIARVAGVPVRLHVSLAVFFVAIFLSWLGLSGLVVVIAVALALAIHELGHALAAANLGCEIRELLMGPIGNLVGPRGPGRPIETTLVHVAGPAANLLAALGLFAGLHFLSAASADLWDPRTADVWRGPNDPASYLALLFKANLWIGLANLLPLYPLDGGRMVREALQLRLHPFQANLATVILGSVVGLLIFGLGLWFHYGWVAALGGYGGYLCLRRQRELEFLAEAQENEFGYDFSEGYTSLERSMTEEPAHHAPPSFSRTLREWLEERRQRRGEFIEAELDRILQKIHDTGLTSLSRNERRILDQASKRRKT